MSLGITCDTFNTIRSIKSWHCLSTWFWVSNARHMAMSGGGIDCHCSKRGRDCDVFGPFCCYRFTLITRVSAVTHKILHSTSVVPISTRDWLDYFASPKSPCCSGGDDVTVGFSELWRYLVDFPHLPLRYTIRASFYTLRASGYNISWSGILTERYLDLLLSLLDSRIYCFPLVGFQSCFASDYITREVHMAV